MTEQGTSEVPKERFIQLIDPNEQLYEVQGGWSTKEILIPAIGIMATKLLAHVIDEDTDPAVAIDQGKLIQASADQLFENGLFPLEIEIKQITPKESGLVCSMRLQEQNIILDSAFDFAHDEHAKDPLQRDFAFTDKWKIRGMGKLFYFYLPKDVHFLSTLQFKFGNHQDHFAKMKTANLS